MSIRYFISAMYPQTGGTHRTMTPGLRPADPDPSIVASPSDGIVGAFGRIEDTKLFQIKGAPYALLDLLGDPALVEQHRNGRFVTLRLTSSMYHRFHAPADCRIEKVTFIRGDVWNVNPIALKRVERLFCKNERAVLQTRLSTGEAPWKRWASMRTVKMDRARNARILLRDRSLWNPLI